MADWHTIRQVKGLLCQFFILMHKLWVLLFWAEKIVSVLSFKTGWKFWIFIKTHPFPPLSKLPSLSVLPVTLMMLRQYWWCDVDDVMITRTSSVPVGPGSCAVVTKPELRGCAATNHPPCTPWHPPDTHPSCPTLTTHRQPSMNGC